MSRSGIVVDCRGHLLGRVAATVAKELLNGEHIVLVRCEEMNISGSLYRNKLKYEAFLRKKSNTNPRRSSHIHYRSPSKIVWRTIRGMLPHKFPRGAAALGRLRVFEGIPSEFETRKRVVIPAALKVVCLKRHRDFCRLGDLASRVGWKHEELLRRLEERRKVRSQAFYLKKQEKMSVFKAAKAAAVEKLSKEEKDLLGAVGEL